MTSSMQTIQGSVLLHLLVFGGIIYTSTVEVRPAPPPQRVTLFENVPLVTLVAPTPEPPQPATPPLQEPPPAVAELPAPPQAPVLAKPRQAPRSSKQPRPAPVPESVATTETTTETKPVAIPIQEAPSPVSMDHPPDHNAAYLRNPKPDYPPFARRMGQEGLVVLRVEVDAQGGVQAVTLTQSSGFPLLDQAAQQTVAGYRFIPAQRNGQPVAESLQVPIRFKLEES